MARPNTLPPKLEAVIVRLGKAKDLNVTKAVKLPYLVDVVANHVLGRPITEGHHQTWDKGVVTSEAWHFLNRASESDRLRLQEVRWSEEKKLIVSKGCDDSELTAEEKAVVDAVIQEFGSMSAGELGAMTKMMNPEIGQWGSNHRADSSESAFDRMSPEYQEMAAAVARIPLRELEQGEYEVVDSIEDAIA